MVTGADPTSSGTRAGEGTRSVHEPRSPTSDEEMVAVQRQKHASIRGRTKGNYELRPYC